MCNMHNHMTLKVINQLHANARAKIACIIFSKANKMDHEQKITGHVI